MNRIKSEGDKEQVSKKQLFGAVFLILVAGPRFARGSQGYAYYYGFHRSASRQIRSLDYTFPQLL